MIFLRVLTCIIFLVAACFVGGLLEEQHRAFPMPPRPIRLIVTDVDGTLTGRDHKFVGKEALSGVYGPLLAKEAEFVEKNIEGFQLARKLGIEVAFATGRDPEFVRKRIGEEAMQKMGYGGAPGIYLNGAYVVNDKGTVLVDGRFSKRLQHRLLQAFASRGLVNFEFGWTPCCKRSLRSGDNADNTHYAINVYADSSTLDMAAPQLEEEFRGEVEFTRWHPKALGAQPAGFTKGTGLRVLASEIEILPEEVLVIGDAENDLPMFELAGTAIAVRNAQDVAKSSADYITVDSKDGALLAVVREIEKNGFYPGASVVAVGQE